MKKSKKRKEKNMKTKERKKTTLIMKISMKIQIVIMNSIYMLKMVMLKNKQEEDILEFKTNIHMKLKTTLTLINQIQMVLLNWILIFQFKKVKLGYFF